MLAPVAFAVARGAIVTRRYKAFISYSWADRTWGEWLHRTLETYRAPKGVADGQSLNPIFKDREEEAAGGSVGAAIEAALGASEFLIVICSPRSAQSTWVNREVAWFKTHKDKANILALIVDGEPGASAMPGREAEECFPKTLTRKVGADLQPTEEWEDAPLAADARAEGDGRRGAKLKLAAALLGVGLDALVRRDERRRTVRRRLVTSAAFGLAAILGGLAIYAFSQRDAAVVARNEAVKARDDAEGLIELILTDLKSDLEGFGTLKSVTQIGNRAIGYYEGQDIKALTPDQLGRRARVLLMLGEADNKRGDLTAALARYETAAATTQEQLARDPENPQRMFDHAQSVFWVGYIAWQRGDRVAAKRQFTEYHDLAQRLVAKDPANEEWQAELKYALNNLGTLAMDDSEAEKAEEYFRHSLEIALALLEKAPEDVERVLAAGQSYAWLGDALNRQGNLLGARAARITELTFYNVPPKGSQNAEIQDANIVALYRLSQLEIASGRLSEALDSAVGAVENSGRLYAIDPENVDVGEQYVRSLTVYGECLAKSGRLQQAIIALERSIEIAERLSRIDLDAIRWEGAVLVDARLALAKIRIATGEIQSGQALLEQIVARLSTISGDENADNRMFNRRYAEALANRARVSSEFASDWIKIVGLLSEGNQAHEARLLLAEGQYRIGRIDEARKNIRLLLSSEFRHPDLIDLLKRYPTLVSE